MIIIKLKGGLGNQLFQYACARSLAERNHDSVKLDLSWYQPGGVVARDTVRPYALEAFTIAAQTASDEEIARVQPGRVRAFGVRVMRKLRPINSYHFDPAVLNQSGDVYLEGFFQSEKYFVGIASVIRDAFRLRQPMRAEAQALLQEIRQSRAVALHVRRGDYVHNRHAATFHGTCSPAYYQEAMALIAKQVEAPTFFVFSDDIEWVKTHMHIPHAVYVSREGIADYEELMLMAACHHAIIANSSFSWWGAWLNEHPDKIVIAPKQWVADPRVDTSDAVPASWIRI